jgi:hypothetical protein
MSSPSRIAPPVIALDRHDSSSDAFAIAETSAKRRKKFVGTLDGPGGMCGGPCESFFLASTPDREWWVLWFHWSDDGMTETGPTAMMPRPGTAPRAAARALLEATCQYLAATFGEMFNHVWRAGGLSELELRRVMESAWGYPDYALTLHYVEATGGWGPVHEFQHQYRYASVYGVDPVGPHRELADALFLPLRVCCVACRGRGFVGGPTDVPRQCGQCEATGGAWWCSDETIAAARALLAKEHPHALIEVVVPVGTWVVDPVVARRSVA